MPPHQHAVAHRLLQKGSHRKIAFYAVVVVYDKVLPRVKDQERIRMAQHQRLHQQRQQRQQRQQANFPQGERGRDNCFRC